MEVLEIDVVDDRLVRLIGDVMVPARFIARFDDEWHTTIEIHFVDGRPVVRSLHMASEVDDLADHDLRRPLRSQLVPAAVRRLSDEFAATRLSGETSDQKMRPVSLEGVPDKAVIGMPQVVARVRQHQEHYRSAAAAVSRRGRPTQLTDPEVLVEIADVYRTRNSIADVLARLPGVSRSTAYRRIKEARQAGLLDSQRERNSPGGS
jgi:transposase